MAAALDVAELMGFLLLLLLLGCGSGELDQAREAVFTELDGLHADLSRLQGATDALQARVTELEACTRHHLGCPP